MGYHAVLALAKIIGSTLIILTGTLIGHGLASSLERKEKEAEMLENALVCLSSEVSYALTPLPVALRSAGKAAGGAVGDILISMGKLAGIANKHTAQEAFVEAVSKYQGTLPPSELLTIVDDLSKNLGFLGHREQIRHIEIAIDKVKRYKKSHEEEVRKKARLYRYLGALSAVCLVIVLA
jgi:stage III sporulation protein AB